MKDGRASIRALTFSEFLVTRHSLSSIKLGRGQIPVLWLAMGMVRSQKAVKEFQLKESFAEGKRFCLLNANDLAVICSDAHWQLVTGRLDANANSIIWAVIVSNDWSSSFLQFLGTCSPNFGNLSD